VCKGRARKQSQTMALLVVRRGGLGKRNYRGKTLWPITPLKFLLSFGFPFLASLVKKTKTKPKKNLDHLGHCP
jgi:hypothetical protein